MQAVGKVYTLSLEFQHGDERLTGARIEPSDVDISDLIATCITVSTVATPFNLQVHSCFSLNSLQEGGGTQGAAPLLMEVRSRLSCRLALTSELDQLKSRFTVNKIEVSLFPSQWIDSYM